MEQSENVFEEYLDNNVPDQPALLLVFIIICIAPNNIFSSPGLCPWRAYVVTQLLVLASIGICVGVQVSTMFGFDSKVCIVF